jgi:hypothetical protein
MNLPEGDMSSAPIEINVLELWGAADFYFFILPSAQAGHVSTTLAIVLPLSPVINTISSQ